MTSSILFVQNRTHRAGAQTCLMRLMRHETIRKWNPVLLCSPGGWLPAECARFGVPVIEQEFPRSRSLWGRLFSNSVFARQVTQKLEAHGLKPSLVHANDHQEGLLGLKLAATLNARTAMFLRSPGMTESDYRKYRCGEYQFLSAVGDDFRARAQAWEKSKKVELIYDGIYADEFSPPKPKPPAPPQRVLVVGSPLDWKGWADLTAALYLLEQKSVALPAVFDFTGVQPDTANNDLELERLSKIRCNFLGRVEKFHELVRGYDLVINPSRMETFGMAAIEVLAAGVPLLSSRSGIIEQVQNRAEMLFEPADPASLAGALENLLRRWTEIPFDLEQSQNLIREKFLVDHAAAQLDAAYSKVAAQKLNG
jgi:glycosyltransferase involved in cell wall biosynthesis